MSLNRKRRRKEKKTSSTMKVKNSLNRASQSQLVPSPVPILPSHNSISPTKRAVISTRANLLRNYGRIGTWEYIVKWKMYWIIKIEFTPVQHRELDLVIKRTCQTG